MASVVKYEEEEIVRGDGRDYAIVVKDEDRAIVDITGAKIWYTVKSSYDDIDADAKFQLDTDTVTEIEITDAEAGEATIYIKNIHTANLDIGSYYFDVQIKEVGREPRTLAIGILWVKADVTLSIA